MVTATQIKPSIVLDVELFNEIMVRLGCTTDQECADRLGIHRSTVARMRANERTPSGDVMFRVSEALGVQVEILFGRPRKDEA